MDSFQVTCIYIVVENKAYEEHLRGFFPTIGNLCSTWWWKWG